MKKAGKILKSPSLYLIIMLVIMGWFCADILRAHRELAQNQLSSRDGWNFHFALDLGENDTWFASEFIRGAEEEAKKHGIALEIKGENSSYQEEEKGFIQWACNANIDAVISTGEPADRYPDIVQALKNASTDCAVVLNDISYEGNLYIGPSNFTEGYQLGELLGEKYQGQEAQIALLYSETEKQIPHSRVDGFYEGLSRYPNIRILEERMIESSILEAMGQAEDILLTRSGLQEFICFDENILDGVARGVIDLNRVKTIDISGIGYSQKVQDYMEKNIVDIVIADDYYQMGKEAVNALYLKKKEKETHCRIITEFGIRMKNGDRKK